ncbi:hypothetical protein [uncultured Desulfovibrio sp.]|uniref:hypothetical protein n=1 Tax=uncultured Desulfovibrio sp. TaxID=167968 RepID=UPI00260A1D58|nr:hypothetical protein [uncultured Desulfovibrio sp.]
MTDKQPSQGTVLPERAGDPARSGILLVGGGQLCAAAVPLLRAAGLVPAGVIHGPHCDFVAEAGLPPLGRDADLARLRRDFCQAVVTAPHKQEAGLRRLLCGLLEELGFALAGALHPGARVDAEACLGAGNLVFADAALAAGCRTGTACLLLPRVRLGRDCHLGDHVHLGAGTRLGAGVTVADGAHLGRDVLVGDNVRLGRDVLVDDGLRLEKNIFVPDGTHLTAGCLPGPALRTTAKDTL